jgi:hypothetical protein
VLPTNWQFVRRGLVASEEYSSLVSITGGVGAPQFFLYPRIN